MGRIPRMLAVLLASDDPRTSWSFHILDYPVSPSHLRETGFSPFFYCVGWSPLGDPADEPTHSLLRVTQPHSLADTSSSASSMRIHYMCSHTTTMCPHTDVLMMNEWVLIATWKKSVWSTRIGWIVPIWNPLTNCRVSVEGKSGLMRRGTVCHNIESPQCCHAPGPSVLGSPLYGWQGRVLYPYTQCNVSVYYYYISVLILLLCMCPHTVELMDTVRATSEENWTWRNWTFYWRRGAKIDRYNPRWCPD